MEREGEGEVRGEERFLGDTENTKTEREGDSRSKWNYKTQDHKIMS